MRIAGTAVFGLRQEAKPDTHEHEMCLAVPGKILSVAGEDALTRTGRVSFGGVVKEVSLAYTPEAQVDDYVIVHVGFALNVLDEDEAGRVFSYLKEMGELAELESDPDESVAPT